MTKFSKQKSKTKRRFSQFYKIWVRPSIAREFTDAKGDFDDMMAGLHEIRARMTEKRRTLELARV